jgi:hypothetical protein
MEEMGFNLDVVVEVQTLKSVQLEVQVHQAQFLFI